MEVHHHSHTSRRKWTHYFWEFLMLFMAVFCGFLAEYQLEHLIEKDREKQYMQSLLMDLSADTLTISNGYSSKVKRINAIDTVFAFFNSNQGAKTISGKLFKTIRWTTYSRRFIRNNITMNQLKNAGGMRLIHKRNIADSISAYDQNCESLDLYNEFYFINSQLGNRFSEKLVNTFDLMPFYITNNSTGIVDNIPDSIVIRLNTTDLSEPLNFLMLVKVYARQEINSHNNLKERAIRLIELIKKEYHLK